MLKKKIDWKWEWKTFCEVMFILCVFSLGVIPMFLVAVVYGIAFALVFSVVPVVSYATIVAVASSVIAAYALYRMCRYGWTGR
jgi:hypothetical protein